jgi:hypothetical protein
MTNQPTKGVVRPEEDGPPWPAMLRNDLKPMRTDAAAALTSLGASPPEVVYHYTSASGYQGILDSRTVWASHGSFLNDRSELSYVDEVVALVAQSASKGARSPVAKELAGELRRTGWRSPGLEQPYIACFSAVDDRLSQWRAYAGDGRGYALGIRSSAKFQVRGAVPATHAELVRVVYRLTDQAAVIRPFVNASLTR